jgi:hypothetical protein
MHNEKTGIVLYGNLLSDIKTRIRQAHDKVALCANAAIVKQPVSQFDDSVRFWYIHKPIGISGYELTCPLPDSLRSSLPGIEELEAELGGIHKEESGDE